MSCVCRVVPLRLPETGECPSIRRLPKLLEGALADLADALASDTHQSTDALEGHRLRTLVESVVEVENLPLARSQVALEDAVDELAHQLVIGDFLDLRPVDTGETLAEGGGFAIGPIDWRIERQLVGRHLPRGADRLRGLFEQPADFVFVGVALQDLGENRFGARQPNQLRILIEWDSNRPGLLSQRLEYRLSNPPHGVGDELDALIRIEFSDGFQEAFVADGD